MRSLQSKPGFESIHTKMLTHILVHAYVGTHRNDICTHCKNELVRNWDRPSSPLGHPSYLLIGLNNASAASSLQARPCPCCPFPAEDLLSRGQEFLRRIICNNYFLECKPGRQKEKLYLTFTWRQWQPARFRLSPLFCGRRGFGVHLCS
jgi:hypothetical protein